MSADLYSRLRSRSTLHRAWSVVRASGYSSMSRETELKTKTFEENWLNNLDRLARRLREKTFKFENEVGVALSKGKGKQGRRPLVVAPIENRIVRRAILDLLQGYENSSARRRDRWDGIPRIRRIMESPTSVGGIPSRGVPHGLSLIDQAVESGHHWFVRSDIRDFFTRIPLSQVNTFIESSIEDRQFSALFSQALLTNLTNKEELEERHHFALFPSDGIGVAQGSALSALAGNIILEKFDKDMNGRGIVCVRYIDDFILLGKTETKVVAAFKSAQDQLRQLGMAVYDPSDLIARQTGKVDKGNIHNGTDVLGYRISARSFQPCSAAQKALLSKLDDIVSQAKNAMQEAASGNINSRSYLYHHAMVMMHRVTWGWSQSFKYTNVPHVLKSLDKQIDARIGELNTIARRYTAGASPLTRRRVAGVHLLQDCFAAPLPSVTPHQGADENPDQLIIETPLRRVATA